MNHIPYVQFRDWLCNKRFTTWLGTSFVSLPRNDLFGGTKIDADREHVYEQQPKRLLAEIQKIAENFKRIFME